MSAHTPLIGDDPTVVQFVAEDGTLEPCLGDDTLALMIDGDIEADERAQVEEHIDRCSTCRSLLASMVDLGDAAASLPCLAVSAPFSPGHAIDHYTVSELIGRGGMGAVYLAHDAVLERDVAIKVVGAQRLSSKRARERLLKEARATARLNHPNIVTIHAVGEIEGLPYLALEHVQGTRLRDWLSRDAIDVIEGLRLFESIAEALVEAHRAGILHRDLKPENVLIRTDGRVKVVDFGLAREVSVALNDSAARLPSRTATAGTPRYMAPEQWRGEEQSKAVDVWSLGVMLYELVSGGQHPFGADRSRDLDTKALGERIRSGRPAEPLSPASRVDKALAATIMSCLAMRPEDRPGAETVLDALRRPASAPRRRGWVVAAAALSVATAAVVAGAAVSAPTPPSAPTVSPPPAPSTPTQATTSTASSVAPLPSATTRSADTSATATPAASSNDNAPVTPRVVTPPGASSPPKDLYREW